MMAIGLTLAVVLGILIALASDRLDPLAIFTVAVSILVVGGVISVKAAFSGFSNTGVLTVGVLFLLTGSLQQSSLFDRMTRFDRMKPKHFKPWLLFSGVTGLSAFINNTPLVAMMMPIASRIAERTKISASTLLMPISFLAMLGGTLTLVGTSTNLIYSGLLEKLGYDPLGFFELTPIALPAAIAGILIMGLTYHRLPKHNTASNLSPKAAHAHWVRFLVEETSSIIGKTVEAAQLRALRGVYLFGIERDGKLISPITASDVIEARDCLIFTGQTDQIDELKRIDHLVLETDAMINTDYFNQQDTVLVESVVVGNLGMPGETIKTLRFRDRYQAAVIGILRHGRQLHTKPGSVVPQPGDVLLMIAQRDALNTLSSDPSLLILSQSPRKNARSSVNDHLPLVAYLTATLISLVTGTDLLVTALAAVAILLVTKSITVAQALQWLDTKLLIMIALSFAVGEALSVSGAAEYLVWMLLPLVGKLPVEGLLVLSFFIPMVITNVVTNNTAAILSLPIVAALTSASGVDPRPFLLLTAIASSYAFLSPYGYQTNTMVAAVAPYTFSDFVRYGLPVTLVTGGVAVLMARWLYF